MSLFDNLSPGTVGMLLTFPLMGLLPVLFTKFIKYKIRRLQKWDYVNNKEFLAAITDYRQKVHAAKEADKPRPRVTNYLGSCFLILTILKII